MYQSTKYSIKSPSNLISSLEMLSCSARVILCNFIVISRRVWSMKRLPAHAFEALCTTYLA